MTRERTIVPTTLLDWPRVAPLLPELKLILSYLWAGRYTNSIGVAMQFPLRPAAATLGLDPSALATGLGTLNTEKLVYWDRELGEVFVCDWFRFHTFGGVGIAIAQREFRAVQSKYIREALLHAAPWLDALKAPKPNKNKKLPSQHKRQPEHKQKPPPHGCGSGLSHIDDPHLAAVIAECPALWRDALLAEVRAATAKNKIETTPASYARGVLRNWNAAGEPDSQAAAIALAEKTHALAEKEAAEVAKRIAVLAGKRFRGESGIFTARGRADGSVVLEGPGLAVVATSQVLADIASGKLIQVN